MGHQHLYALNGAFVHALGYFLLLKKKIPFDQAARLPEGLRNVSCQNFKRSDWEFDT